MYDIIAIILFMCGICSTNDYGYLLICASGLFIVASEVGSFRRSVSNKLDDLNKKIKDVE